MWEANRKHEDNMEAGGWALNKPGKELIKNVAAYVGLDLPITYMDGRGKNDAKPPVLHPLHQIAQDKKKNENSAKVQ
jgi:hypothetical protein